MKTTKLLDCALIGVCVVIRSNTVSTAIVKVSTMLVAVVVVNHLKLMEGK